MSSLGQVRNVDIEYTGAFMGRLPKSGRGSEADFDETYAGHVPGEPTNRVNRGCDRIELALWETLWATPEDASDPDSDDDEDEVEERRHGRPYIIEAHEGKESFVSFERLPQGFAVVMKACNPPVMYLGNLHLRWGDFHIAQVSSDEVEARDLLHERHPRLFHETLVGKLFRPGTISFAAVTGDDAPLNPLTAIMRTVRHLDIKFAPHRCALFHYHDPVLGANPVLCLGTSDGAPADAVTGPDLIDALVMHMVRGYRSNPPPGQPRLRPLPPICRSADVHRMRRPEADEVHPAPPPSSAPAPAKKPRRR
jgi:hypothetical protein